MSREQVGLVLARIAIGDNRNADDPTVLAHWYQTIGHLRYEDAMRAVPIHFQRSTEYLMPKHIIDICRELGAERQRLLEQGRRLDGAARKDAPRPDNFDEMTAAYKDPVQWAKELAKYNEQLIREGHPPLYENPSPTY